MKKYQKIVFVIGGSLMLASCQKAGSSVVESTFPKHITRQVESQLTIDAEVTVPEQFQSEAQVLELKLRNLDAPRIISKHYPQAEKLYANEAIYKVGESYINISDGDYYYDDQSQSIYGRFFTEQKELLAPTSPDLAELDVEDALGVAKSYLSDVGIEQIRLKAYYVLSPDFLEGQYNEVKQEASWQEDVATGREVEKNDWDKEKGAYVLNFEVVENGLPVSQGAYYTKDNEYIEGTSIKVCCNEKGVVFVHGVKNYEVSAPRGTKKIQGVETLIKGIQHKFGNLIIKEPITISKIQLVYQTQKTKGTLCWMPVWEVQYLQQSEGAIEEGVIYFDVETGKEIVVY